MLDAAATHLEHATHVLGTAATHLYHAEHMLRVATTHPCREENMQKVAVTIPIHYSYQLITLQFFYISISFSLLFSEKSSAPIFKFRKKHYFCTALVHYFAVRRKVIKRETGVIPVQSRCCKLL